MEVCCVFISYLYVYNWVGGAGSKNFGKGAVVKPANLEIGTEKGIWAPKDIFSMFFLKNVSKIVNERGWGGGKAPPSL